MIDRVFVESLGWFNSSTGLIEEYEENGHMVPIKYIRIHKDAEIIEVSKDKCIVYKSK